MGGCSAESLDVADFESLMPSMLCWQWKFSLSLPSSLPSSFLLIPAYWFLQFFLIAAYLFSLFDDCILVSRQLETKVNSLQSPTSLASSFPTKEVSASCIWTSSEIQCAGSLIAHYQLLLLTPISQLLWGTGSFFSVVRIDLLAMDQDDVGQINTPDRPHDKTNAMDEHLRPWNAEEFLLDHN